MTLPVRQEWNDPIYPMLAHAIRDASRLAAEMGTPHVICVRVGRGCIGFEVFTRGSYDTIVRAGLHRDLGVAGTVEVDGTLALDPALNPIGVPW